MMMGLAQPLLYYTAESYLDLERQSPTRHEFLDGLVYAMAGESPNHSRICVNLAGEIRAALKGRHCEAFSPNMKVRTGPGDLYAYPDLSVVCGPVHYHDRRRDVLLNPVVLFEVLSPSAAAYDEGEKFLRYQTINTLRAYVMVSQTDFNVRLYERQDDGLWHDTVISGRDGVLTLTVLECSVPLAEIYDRVDFAAE